MLRSTSYIAAALAVAALFAVGCESNGGEKHDMHQGSGATGAMMTEDAGMQAVTCEKCEVTWVKSPVTNDKGRIIDYRTTKSHECPDCRAAAQNFFATGRLQHECKTCGPDALQKCEAHIGRS